MDIAEPEYHRECRGIGSPRKPYQPDCTIYFQISYVDEVQMHFLRLLHMQAEQKFTYFCVNSIGWFSTETNTHDQSINLLADNEYEYVGRDLRQKDVPYDGCRVSTIIN